MNEESKRNPKSSDEQKSPEQYKKYLGSWFEIINGYSLELSELKEE